MGRNLRDRFIDASSKCTDAIANQYKKGDRWVNISYGELKNKIESLSVFLSNKGIRSGDTVGILLENRPEWGMIFFATVYIGAIVVPINPVAGMDEVKNILNNAKCRAVFSGDASHFFKEEMRSGKLPFMRDVISVDSEMFRDAVEKRRAPAGNEEIDEHSVASILYTSGTTDSPKGVMLTHGNLLSNCESIYKRGFMKQKDSIMSILPLYDTYPLTVTMLIPLLFGGGVKIIYPGSMRRETIMAAMSETNPAVLVAVPQVFYPFQGKVKEAIEGMFLPYRILIKTMMECFYVIRKATGINLARYLFRDIHKKFGEALRLFITGGAKLDERAGRDLFKLGFTVMEGYGLTEAAPILTLMPLGKTKESSVGTALDGVELQIVNKNKDGVGEIVARGPNIMKGYYEKEDLTAEVIQNGWFRTGDLGHIDKDGYLFITGRKKDIIVLSSGMNIHPKEIENVYARGGLVQEMCVFDVPSFGGEKETRVLWAVVIPKPEPFGKYGEKMFKEILKGRFEKIAQKLPAHKRIMGFSVTTGSFPRTSLGKIKRYRIREMYFEDPSSGETASAKTSGQRHPERREHPEANPIARRIIEHIEAHTKEKNIEPKHSLELDLGIDFVGRAELASSLEKEFNIKIKEGIIEKASTVKDIIKGIEPLLSDSPGE